MATTDELIKQVQNLTSATTDLLDATNVSKEILNAAVDSATGSAQSAELANISAVEARGVTVAATSEAIAAKDQAVAIVHNDEGSLTSKPGAYPVADSKGHLDINWTPLLAAMYPYSGVIGSVDKLDLIHFDARYANVIWIKERSYNIAGRLVNKITGHDLHPNVGYAINNIPEAESTAARAIAFDDIFLDWNGTIQTYRSITPHRTTTGYDRDKIATEHGYSKVQKGLYKTGDTYALLLGRVARRNKGAYHPVFNPEGSSRVAFKPGLGLSGGSYWYSTDVVKYTTPEDAFSAHTGTGSIAGGFVGNPEQKPYDAIYADDFTPLYYSAKNVVDRQALLFDSFNRAVTGETFSGAEGTGIGVRIKASLPSDPTSNKIYGTDHGFIGKPYNGAQSGSVDWPLINITKGFMYTRVHYVWFSEGYNSTCDFGDVLPAEKENTSIGDDLLLIVPNTELWKFDLNRRTMDSARPQFLMCDIIGAPEAWPEEWKTNGLPGNWLSVGEEGESLIPDGTSKNYKLSRKCLECYQVLQTSDKGVTWSDSSSSWKPELEAAPNGRTASIPATSLHMIFYRTSANPFEFSNTRPKVLNVGNALYGDTNHAFQSIAPFVSNLVNKIPTSAGIERSLFELNKYTLNIDNNFYRESQYSPTHQQLDTSNLTVSSVACKMFSFLATNYLFIAYKEMKHNGTSWGDDNKFNIVDKQSTVTDLNGETVIVGQKRVELPYQFDGVTY